MITSLFDRQDYPTLSENHYLNQASLGLIGRPAVDAMHQFIMVRSQLGQENAPDAAAFTVSDREDFPFPVQYVR